MTEMYSNRIETQVVGSIYVNFKFMYICVHPVQVYVLKFDLTRVAFWHMGAYAPGF